MCPVHTSCVIARTLISPPSSYLGLQKSEEGRVWVIYTIRLGRRVHLWQFNKFFKGEVWNIKKQTNIHTYPSVQCCSCPLLALCPNSHITADLSVLGLHWAENGDCHSPALCSTPPVPTGAPGWEGHRSGWLRLSLELPVRYLGGFQHYSEPGPALWHQQTGCFSLQ